ncbi:hypothetical protein J6590_039526 [Homalodisca vitripennis]|nr:hypothetical protein J6590_039526 [Homalodisca vitripennis]
MKYLVNISAVYIRRLLNALPPGVRRAAPGSIYRTAVRGYDNKNTPSLLLPFRQLSKCSPIPTNLKVFTDFSIS